MLEWESDLTVPYRDDRLQFNNTGTAFVVSSPGVSGERTWSSSVNRAACLLLNSRSS